MRFTDTLIATLSLLVLLGGCRVSPRIQPDDVTETGALEVASGATHDFTNEVTPRTPESLEVVPSNAVLPISLSASGTIIIGSPTAPRLRIVTDPSCVYCQEFVLGDQVWLEQNYVASGKLALEIVYLPMDLIGALNAKVLLCSAEQDQFVDIEHSIAINALTSEAEAITRAKTLRLASKAFTTCLRSKKTASTLVVHERIADAMQVTRVPSFAVGAERWIGLESRATLQGMIERAL